MKKLLIAKNSVVKIQILVENHESQPVKSNPALAFLCYLFSQRAQSQIFDWVLQPDSYVPEVKRQILLRNLKVICWWSLLC